MSLALAKTELETLRKTIQEVGVGTHYASMLQALDSLEQTLAQPSALPLKALVLLPPDGSTAHHDLISKLLNVAKSDVYHGNKLTIGGVSLQFQRTDEPLSLALGQVAEPVVLAFFDPSAQISTRQIPSLTRYAMVARWYHFAPKEAEISNPVIPGHIHLEQVNASEQIEGEALKWLEQLHQNPAGPLLMQHAALTALEQIALLNRDNIAQESRLVTLRKALQTQLGNAAKMEESSFNASDLNSQLRSKIQGGFSELEKNIKQRWEDMNKPQTGEFFKLSQQYADALEKLEVLENLEKSEKVTLRPDPEFEAEICNKVQSDLLRHFEYDARSIQNGLDKMGTEINQLLKSSQIAPIEPSDVRRRFQFQKIVDSFANFTKSYQGEMTKPGFTEYFVALREYTSLISTVVGLLMPIVIGIGGFEVVDEFVLKQKEQQTMEKLATPTDQTQMLSPAKQPSRWEAMSFSQKLRTVVYTLSAVISIGMLVFGLYTLSQRIPQMRAEAQLREMRKARESLMSESRRMFSESSREWTSLLSNFYREQSGTVQTTVEKNLKDFQQIRDKKLTESRNQVQRQAQGIDLIQKKLSGVDRVKDQILQNIANLRKDAAQGIAQKIKQINT